MCSQCFKLEDKQVSKEGLEKFNQILSASKITIYILNSNKISFRTLIRIILYFTGKVF